FLNSNKNLSSYSIDNETITGGDISDKTIITHSKLFFNNCTFQGQVRFKPFNATCAKNPIELNNCKLNDSITISSYSNITSPSVIEINGLTEDITTKEFGASLHILNCSNVRFRLNNLELSKFNIEKNQNSETQIGESLEEKYISKIDHLRISHNNGNFYYLNHLKVSKLLSFYYDNNSKFNLNSGIINRLNIYRFSDSNIVIGSVLNLLLCNTIDLKKSIIDTNSELVIKRGNYNSLKFKEIINKGIIQLMDFEITDTHGNEVNFKDANMGKTYITNVIFSIKNIKLNGSYLTDMKLSGIIWPEKNIIDRNYIAGYRFQGIPYLNALRDSYRQLKAMSINAKDTVNALKFKANEMEVYLFQLKKENKRFSSDFAELYLSKWSSNFGLSIGKPVIRLLSIHLIIFFFVLLFSDFRGMTITFNPELMSWDNFFTSCSYYAELLIPIRKFSSDLNSVVDIIMRMSSGFFIYHIIKATRKFAKL
ncbi:MAG: hypothetical protein JKY42_00015, partial [Flavobacteriales bacterium]|nr:hypothetical protein [Flavobacteriales bacterium]